MEEIQNNPTNLCEDVLAHHGKLGMKWGIRRYQPYPDDYTGDGKFVGKKSTRAEKRQARHIAKTNTRIKNAVDTGNKKKLKKYKDEMSPEEYEKKYAETIKNGIDNAVKDRDKSALKKYKDDLNKREYQHQKDRIEFKEAIDNDNSHKTKKLLSKVDPEDVTEATNLIRSRVALQDQKLSKIRQDSELMAKMDKLASGLGKVSKISQNVSNITSSFMSVNKSMTEFANAQKEADKKRKEKELEKVIRSGDLKKIRENEKKMTQSQLQEAYDRIIQSGSEEDIRKAAPYMNNKQVTAVVQKLSQMDKLISSKKEDTPVEEAKNSPAVQVVTDWIESSQFDNMNLGGTTVGSLRDSFTRWEYQNTGSRATPYGFRHSDDISYEDVLAHHGVLGMKWGVRRYQKKNGSLTPEGLKRYRSVRKDIRIEAGKLKALETNMRNKADIAAPAELKRDKAKEYYEETLRKSSKRSIFDSRAKRESRAKDLRIAEYNLEEATKAAERSRKSFDKADKMYNMQLEKLQNRIESAKKKYGEFVNDLNFSDTDLGTTYSDKTYDDVSLWTKKVVDNYGMIKTADIAETVIEMEKLLDEKMAG